MLPDASVGCNSAMSVVLCTVYHDTYVPTLFVVFIVGAYRSESAGQKLSLTFLKFLNVVFL